MSKNVYSSSDLTERDLSEYIKFNERRTETRVYWPFRDGLTYYCVIEDLNISLSM